MKFKNIFIILILFIANTEDIYSQSIPWDELKFFLIASNELDTSNSNFNYENENFGITIDTLFSCSERNNLFLFRGNVDSPYYYLLAQKNDTFQILNVIDIAYEYRFLSLFYFQKCVDQIDSFVTDLLPYYSFNENRTNEKVPIYKRIYIWENNSFLFKLYQRPHMEQGPIILH